MGIPGNDAGNFSAPMEVHKCSALLFDMDGTLIDSTPAIEKYWAALGAEIGVDPQTILATSHGRRTIDTLQILAPQLATWDYILQAEGRIPKLYGSDAVIIPGAQAVLDSVTSTGIPWAIVTSGTEPLVHGWLDVLKLAHPGVLVTAEQVQRGKPDPAAYLLGAKKLGFEAADGASILVFEDAPSGIKAGKAAGFKVVALATSHSLEQLRDAGADWIVRDMRSIKVTKGDGKTMVDVEIKDSLVV